MSLITEDAPAATTEPTETQDTETQTEGQTEGTDTSTTTETEATDEAKEEWYHADGVKGEGPRPEWLKEKYKSAAEQAKAYNDLEKRLGGFKGAPDKYDLSIEGHPDVKFADNDPLIEEWVTEAKAANMSQELMTKSLSTCMKALSANQPDIEAEIQKLGPNGKQEVNAISQWARNEFSDDEYGTFKSMLNSADGVRLFEKISHKLRASNNAPPNNRPSHYETEESVLALIGTEKYNSDPLHRKDVEKRLAAAIGNK